jgi:SAM-dependent methyltransferase
MSRPSTFRDGEDDVLQEQIEYYRARSTEYDEWLFRRGRYDHGPVENEQWFAEFRQVADALDDFAPRGQVLELAGGTGYWTKHLLKHAASVTVVDASPEMLALNRERVGDERVRYLPGDIFAFDPDRAYDVAFFGFWLSHVPPERFAPFWEMVGRCLALSGRVFFVDSLYNPVSTARDHRLEGPDATTALRRLNDGREYRIVKVFYRPEELSRRLTVLGWQVEVRATANHCLYGWGRRDPQSVARS